MKATHRCATCGHVWECFQTKHRQGKKCPVDTAVGVNKQGPFCGLCLHLEMAQRFAANRHIQLTVTRRRLKVVSRKKML